MWPRGLRSPGFGLNSYEPQFPIVKEAVTEPFPPATAQRVGRAAERHVLITACEGCEWE